MPITTKLGKSDKAVRKLQTDWRKRWKPRLLKAARKKVSGEVLNRKTGRLWRSLKTVDLDARNSSEFGIALQTDVLHGKAWESGFTAKRRIVVPRTRKALKFKHRGKVIFRKKTVIPRKRFKARPFMRPAIMENKEAMMKDLGRSMEVRSGDVFPKRINITLRLI